MYVYIFLKPANFDTENDIRKKIPKMSPEKFMHNGNVIKKGKTIMQFFISKRPASFLKNPPQKLAFLSWKGGGHPPLKGMSS